MGALGAHGRTEQRQLEKFRSRRKLCGHACATQNDLSASVVRFYLQSVITEDCLAYFKFAVFPRARQEMSRLVE